MQGTLLADKCWWTIDSHTQQPAGQHPGTRSFNSSGSGATPEPATEDFAAGELVQCVSAALRDTGLCLQMMQSTNNMHLNVFAADTEWLDVRVGSSGASSSSSRDSTPDADATTNVPWESAAAQPGTPAGTDDHSAGSQLDAAGLGRVVRWASCGDEVVARRALGSHSPFAGFSMDAEVPTEAAVRRISISTNPAHQQQQRQTVAGVLLNDVRSIDARSNVPAACTFAADELAGSGGGAVMGDGAEQVQPGAASKAASRDGGRSDLDGGDQQLGAFDLFPPLLQSAAQADRGPDIAIIKILDELPADESAHLGCKGKRAGCKAAADASRGVACSSGAEAAFKLYFGYLAEGTMAIEVS
jgi:hypothetical protein